MNKIIYLTISTLSILLFFTGCSKDNYIGNADDETKTLIGETILNYELIAHPNETNMVFDESDVREVGTEKYTKIISGYGYENYNSYKNIVENTFSENMQDVFLDFSREYSSFKDFNDSLYIRHDYKRSLNPDLEKVDLDSLNIIYKTENVLFVNYKVKSNIPFISAIDRKLILEKVNGKYLVNSRDISDFQVPKKNEESLISNYYNLKNDGSTLILRGPTISSNNNVEECYFRVFKFLDSGVELKYACIMDFSNGNEILNLNVSDNKMINPIFSMLHPENDNIEMLVSYDKDISELEDKMEKYPEPKPSYYLEEKEELLSIEFSSYGGENREDHYVLIPKYITENNISYKVDEDSQAFYDNVYSHKIIALSGNYIVQSKNENGNITFNTRDIKNNTIPDKILILDYIDLNAFLKDIDIRYQN